MTYRHVNIRNLTYSEFLATLPWVMLRPNHLEPMPCSIRSFGHVSKPCKVNAQLVYLDLEGNTTYWCHHHLVEKISEHHFWNGDKDPEVRRVETWWKKHERAAFTEKKLPLEEVDYLRHLKVNEKRCDVDPNELDLDEMGRP